MTAPPALAQNDRQKAGGRVRLALLGLVVLAVAIRAAGVDRPLVGNFATKNVVYAMIARNWAEQRTTAAYPMLDCLVGGRRSLHLLEFPVSAYLSGWLWRRFGGSLDVWGRATAIAFTAAAVGLLFLFVRRRHGHAAAVGAGFALALSPVGIVYGQSFMLEASLVFFTVATFDALDRWLAGGRWLWLAAAAAAAALLLLTKIYMLVLLLPLAANVLSARRDGEATEPQRPRWRRAVALAALAIATLPAIAWLWHAVVSVPNGPLADRVYYSLRQSVAVHGSSHALLGSPDFWRRVLDDLAGVVLTPVGFMLAAAGLLDRRWREHAAWLAAMLLLLLALPRKFHEMNYYWMAVLPPLCVMAGLGWQVIRRRLAPGRVATTCLVLLALGFSLRYAVTPAFVTPDEDRGVVAAGRAVEKLTAPDEPVVTMHGTTIDLLYYCNRPGWAVAPGTPRLDRVLDGYRRQGARYLVVAGPEAAERPPAVKRRHAVFQGDGFAVFGL